MKTRGVKCVSTRLLFVTGIRSANTVELRVLNPIHSLFTTSNPNVKEDLTPQRIANCCVRCAIVAFTSRTVIQLALLKRESSKRDDDDNPREGYTWT